MRSEYFNERICKYIPLSQVISPEEKVLWNSIPAKHIVAKILYNTTRLYYSFPIVVLAICEFTLIWLSLPYLIAHFNYDFLISFIILLIILNYLLFFLLRIVLHIKLSTFASQDWYSEYILTGSKLYLKKTRFSLYKIEHPAICKIQIIDLSIIQTIKLYQSFWDKRYKETSSLRLKLRHPFPSIHIRHIPDSEIAMHSLIQGLNAVQTSPP
ncbi:MAG: hypothetical protein ACTSRC_08435 [Candidatus Helarchaeota archaeon]